MILFISASPLGHLKCSEDKSFISSRNKFQPYIILFTKYFVLYKIVCKTHYISLNKKE